jgi:TolB-like protein
MQEPAQSRRAVKFGVFEADLAARELRKNGLKIRLQDQPFQVLALLLENRGYVVTREELRQKLWPADTFVDFDNGLNTCINKIREALCDSAEKPKFIETLPRRGYRFIALLSAAANTVPRRIESLAVLPLENLSNDPEQEYFADGMTEALITSLVKISALRVVSRTSAMLYKGARKPLAEIARELEVETVVEGTVQRSGDRVRISAQLIQAATDTHMWAESYERDLRDVLALQAEVARAIAREIQVKLTPQEQLRLAQSQQVDPKVYELYLKGRYYWKMRTEESMKKGAQYFQQAIELDPHYAPAYAGLSDTASRLGFWGYVPAEEGCGRGKTSASQALALDDSLAEVHAALAFSVLHYDYHSALAERETRLAVELDPRSPYAAQVYALHLVATGRIDEGIFQAMRSTQLDPFSPIILWSASALLYHSRQFDRAIAQARKCLELAPTYPAPWWTIGLALTQKRTHDTGIQELEKATEASGENQLLLGALGYCYAAAGQKGDAKRVLERFRELSGQRYVSAYWPAVIHGTLGESEEAFRLLEEAYREHSAWMLYVKVAAYFDSMRSDPRFDQLTRRMKFPEV